MIICYTFLFYRTSILEYILHARTHARTHTHTHTFNGPLSGTTQVSQYQKGKTNLDFIETRHSEWQRHQLGRMQVCTSLQTDNHASTPPLKFFYRPDALPAAQPTASKHWRGMVQGDYQIHGMSVTVQWTEENGRMDSWHAIHWTNIKCKYHSLYWYLPYTDLSLQDLPDWTA